jgi:integrase
VLRAATRERTSRGDRATQAPPVTLPVLRAMVEVLDPARIADARDHTLLLLGWSAFARRSELAGLHLSDVTETEHGLELWVRHAKTDTTGEGQRADLLRGTHPDTDPVTVHRRWTGLLAAHGITDGPLLRTVDRHSRIGDAMSGDAISDAVRRLAVRAGVPRADEYTGHSLRAGAATAAFSAGAPIATVCRAGRWADGSQAVGRYFRSVDRWRDHPLRGVGL